LTPAVLSTPPEGAGKTRICLRADGVLSAGGWATVLRSSLQASCRPDLAAVLTPFVCDMVA